MFETMHMIVPEIYQFHRFVSKVNSKGRYQIRCIAVSTERIYNLQLPEGYPLIPGKQKWQFKIPLLKKIQVNSDSPKVLTLVTSLPKIKPIVSFSFKDEKETSFVLNEIKRLYFAQTNTELEVDQDAKSTPKKKLSRFSFQNFYSN